MDDLNKTLAALERRRDDLRLEAQRLWAQAAGVEAEMAALRAGLQPSGAFESLKVADAVEQVLRSAGQAMSPAEIHAELLARGRRDKPQSMGGTLQHLKHAGRVTKVGRGQWTSTA
jgi:hypothetical protein